ncbi:MAG: 3-oxoacyl-ACP synthase III family protein [Luteibaculaceae bacterium]
MPQSNILITGTGSCIPNVKVPNSKFAEKQFYNADGSAITDPGEMVIRKFKAITGIEERRYAEEGQTAWHLGFEASKIAIADAKVNPEELDLIIVGQNFGDVKKAGIQSEALPSLAAKIKHALGIKNPNCVAFDIVFGCPGWVQGVIVATQAIKAGDAKKALIIGCETLSRVVDPNDRDSMIYADGAGATILELVEEDHKRGIIGYSSQSFTENEAYFLNFGKSYAPDTDPNVGYIKMQGRKIYEFALSNVPLAMKACLEKSNVDPKAVKKVFLHQANEKMDHAIIARFFHLLEIPEPPLVMPMSIHFLGNSSVATVPTLYDLVRKGHQPEHKLHEGDVFLFASVGAGMHINAFAYIN